MEEQERDEEKERALHEVEHMLCRDEAIQAIVDKVVEASKYWDDDIIVKGSWIVQFHNQILEYADDIKEIIEQTKSC